jgi:hypothetical protein
VTSNALFVAAWAFLVWRPVISVVAAGICAAAIAGIVLLHRRRRALGFPFGPVVEHGRLVETPRPPLWRALTPWWVIALSPLLIIPIGLAAQARADTISDVAYLTTLDQFGVPYSSEAQAIAIGHSVCDVLDAGILPRRAALLVADGDGYSLHDANTVVGASIGAYCDKYAPSTTTPSSTVGASMGGRIL